MNLRYALTAAALVALAIGFWLAAGTPPDAVQGEYVRIIHVHVPSSWVAFLAFGGTLLGSAGWLITKRARFDHYAAASAELGVFFTALSLLTGMIWGYVTWGIAWDWGDARMSSTALMFFVYLGYLALRRATLNPVDRARRSAILGIVAFVQVPLVYFSVVLFRTLHQTPSITTEGSTMESSTLRAMLFGLFAFTLAYAAFTTWRTRQLIIEAELTATDAEHAGSAVTAPTLGGRP
ncbi:MAG: cytochrome c biogenesis protein [Acidimicrobiia bacterium]|nr:cytochrome c biogenesis protein [Acidimicrobiia bacterium]